MDGSLLVCGRWVITGAGVSDPVLDDGAVLVDGGRIQAAGPRAQLRAQHPRARILGGDGFAVLPGLINAHHHSHGASHLQQAVNDDEDMFTEIRLALRLQRSTRFGLAVPTAEDVFRMATEGGARLMGKAGTLGRLAEGFNADLVLLDLKTLTWPWVAPEVDPRMLVLLRAQARDVHTVLVDGQVVLENSLPTRFDLGAVARELAERMASTPFPAAALSDANALRPHVEAWYAGWDVPPLSPWTDYSSHR